MRKVGNANVVIGEQGRHVSPWRCRIMRTWISPETTGNATSPTASACKNVREAIEMTKDEKRAMDARGITCQSKDVFCYKEFRYERLAVAVSYAEIDADRPRLGGGNA